MVAQPDSGRLGVRRIMAMSLWLGLAYGLAEAVVVMVLALVPGVLAWRTGNSANVLWFAPAYYGVAFLVLGALAALGSRLRPGWAWDTGLVWVAVWLGGWLGLTLVEHPLSDWAAALLALGISVEVARQYQRRRAVLSRLMLRSLPVLAAAVLLVGVVVAGTGRYREWQAMRSLPPAPAGRPNVLLLVLDTQRADHLSAYGYARPTSPNLDRFAAAGTLFLNGYSSSSWTLPSHASLMTARPLHEHLAGVIRRPYLDGRFPTLAEALRRNGYATGGFVANVYWTGRQTGLDRGFIRYEDFWGNLGDALARTALGRRLAYQVLPRFGQVDMPGRKRAAALNGDFLEWLDGLDGRRPFFAFLNYFDVHGPLLPPAPYAGRFSSAGEGRRARGIDIGALTGDIVVPAASELRRMKDRYDESVLYLDAQLGRLFEELRRRGVLDNTIVVVTSDHGESWGEHGMMYHGHSLYRETLHVPLVVRYPARVPAGVRDPAVVSIQQLPATIMALAGLGGHEFPGTSVLAGGRAGAPVLAEVARRSIRDSNWPSSRGWLASVVNEEWQFIRRENGATELFNFRRDPLEERNLIGQRGLAELQAQLAGTLRTLAPLEEKGVMTRAALRKLPGAPTSAALGLQ